MKGFLHCGVLLWLGMNMVISLASSSQEAVAVREAEPVARSPKVFLGGLYSTITRRSISLTTTGTRFFTCISTIANTVSCSGRRRRRNVASSVKSAAASGEEGEFVPIVHGSLSASPEAGVQTPSEVRDRRGLFLTIFTTSTTTLTLGTFTSDTGTTVSLSVACFDPSFSFPPMCG